MQKFIAKFLLLILIFKLLVPISWIWDVFAVSTSNAYAWTGSDLGWTYTWTSVIDATWNNTATSANSIVTVKDTNTNVLALTNFNLSASGLPVWSTINGIQVDVEWDVNNNKMQDTTVQLTKNWITGIWLNNALNVNGPTAKTTTTYGWPTDMWWTTWTDTELLSSNFWVLLQYRNTRNWTRDVNVYRVNIIIDYTPNNPPTNISLSNQSIASTLPVWSLVWIISTTDPDLTDTHTYSLACAIPWTDDISFAVNSSNLNSNEVFDNTIKSSYNICLRTDDNRWWTFDKNFTITITPSVPNNAPTDITISNNTIAEALPIWSLVWDFSTTDPDIPDIHSYWFTCTIPWVDDSSFSMSGSNLNSSEIFDFTIKSNYNICVTTDDGRWWTFDKNFAISVLVNPNIWYASAASDNWWWSFIRANPSNAVWNTTATFASSTISTNGGFSNELSITDFKLAWTWISTWAIINWIQVDIERLVTNNRMRDNLVQLTKDWTTLVWLNRWNNANWPITKTITSYWWIADLWWTSWTAEEITSSDFWVVLQHQYNRNWSADVNVYRVNITVDYTPNSLPTDITLSNQTIPSAIPVWSLVWSLSTNDLDFSDTHIYSFTCDTPWVDDSSFAISGTSLNSNEIFDDTIKSSYNICLKTDDNRWWTFDKNFTVTILPPSSNNAPTDITLSNQSIQEYIATWSLVWSMTTIDPDISDTHSYSFACSIPWVDDSSFTISWNNLNSNEVFSLATKSTYNICLRTDDGRWWTLDKNFLITILVNPNIWYAWTTADIWWWAFVWTNTTNAIWNTTTTSATSTINVSAWLSNELSLTNFNLEGTWMPTNATINGIQVDVERMVTNNRIQDTKVQLTKDWVTGIWNNNALNANWPTVKTITSYGNITDLWWTTWTANELLDSNFWVILQYQHNRNNTQDVNIYRVNITIDYTVASDTTPPNITAINYASWSLLPWWLHNIIINYNDLDSWIDITSDTVALYKWNWTIWWADISASGLNLASKVITTTGATYPTNDLAFWKYRLDFTISDNSANTSWTGTVYYIDKPEIIISTWSTSMWQLSASWNIFTPEITITVNTVWAPFNVVLNKNSEFMYDTDIISDWDWTKWYWYEKEVFTWSISTINNNEIIATQAQNININWNLNTYIYKIKIWALIDSDTVWWDYEWWIDFWVDFNY